MRALIGRDGRSAAAVGPGRPWWTLAIVALAWFLVLLDDTAVAIALPTVGRDLGLGLVGLEWVVNVYTLAFAVLTLWGGMCVDRFGARRVFLIGLALFSAASLAAGVSADGAALIVARAGQGAAAALVGPAALAILMTSFAGPRRGVALGVWSAVGAAALAGGPLLGAVLITMLGWQSIFLVNVPLGAGMLIIARAAMPAAEASALSSRGAPVDVAGMATSAVALSALVFGLTQAGTYGWRSAALWFILAVAAASLALFVWVERRAAVPLLDLALFRVPNLLAANVLGLLNLAVMCSLFFFLSLYLQTAAEASPIQAGLTLLPLALLAAVVAPAAGWLVSRAGPRWLIGTGMALTAAGLALLAGINVQWGQWQLLPGLLLAGLGIGLATTPITTAAMDQVPARHYGIASATLNSFRMVGLSLGVAIMGAIVAAQWPRDITQSDADPAAFTAGLSNGFLVNAALALAAAGLAIATIRTRLAGHPGRRGDGAQPEPARPHGQPVVEVLSFDGCPNHHDLTTRIHSLLAHHRISATLVETRVDTDEQAVDVRFLGSPTVRVNGHDVDPTAHARHDYGLQCRIYPTEDGLHRTPPDAWIMAALRQASMTAPG